MSYERYKDFRLAPDDNGCWDVLDKEYQQKLTFPSKAAAKRWIDSEVAELTTPDQSDNNYQELQRIYLDWYDHRRPLSGFIKELQAYTDKAVTKARIDELERLLTLNKWLQGAEAVQATKINNRIAQLQNSNIGKVKTVNADGTWSWQLPPNSNSKDKRLNPTRQLPHINQIRRLSNANKHI